MSAEMLVKVDSNDQMIGTVSRKEAHSNADIIHREVGLLIVDRAGTVAMFQQRSFSKRVLPGYWSTSVAGHVDVLNLGTDDERAEPADDTVSREAFEEINLSITPDQLIYLGKELARFDDENRSESHFKYWYALEVDDPDVLLTQVQLAEDEVIDVAFWNRKEIEEKELSDEFLLYEPFLRVVKMYLDKEVNYLIQTEGDSNAKSYR